ncbi:hypothetical protein ACFTUC_30015 [Streptomyces sp. NPDC056944]|uniref:hypothetical protein n=1 Tax=Streptomyces sp. NPDC056944 TaxID=3345972 RepID=UPI0036370DC2
MTTSPNKRRNRIRTAVVTGLMATSALGTAGSALAEGNPTYDQPYEQRNAYNTQFGISEQCSPQSEEFRFRFYYRPNYGGAWINIGKSIWDLKSVSDGSTSNPLTFCGGPSDGRGQIVANNSASAYNWFEGYCGVVYYYKGYGAGATDTQFDYFSPRSGRNLGPTANNNRSIQFIRC